MSDEYIYIGGCKSPVQSFVPVAVQFPLVLVFGHCLFLNNYVHVEFKKMCLSTGFTKVSCFIYYNYRHYA